MNQRIKETVAKVKTDTSGKWVSVEEVEKLVASIINDCISMAVEIVRDNNRKELETYEHHIRWPIEEHFGVEP